MCKDIEWNFRNSNYQKVNEFAHYDKKDDKKVNVYFNDRYVYQGVSLYSLIVFAQ